MSSPPWSTIESDPGVFTELLEHLGAREVQLAELWSLGDEQLHELAPVYGLVFLFKWTPERDDRVPLRGDELDPDFFFARQVVNDACGTQALLSLLLNARDKVDVGQPLGKFYEFVREFPPEMKGEAIGSNEVLRATHNLFARPEPFVTEHDKNAHVNAKDREDAFHFIAYVPFKGQIYELDGLKPGPFLLGEVPSTARGAGEEDASLAWVRAVRPHIEARIARYSTNEIRFNLMALIRDRRAVLREKIAKLEETSVAMRAGGGLEDDPEELAKARDALAAAQEQRAQWTVENVRRKHNYVPFIFQTMRLLAERSMLASLTDAAKQKRSESAKVNAPKGEDAT